MEIEVEVEMKMTTGDRDGGRVLMLTRTNTSTTSRINRYKISKALNCIVVFLGQTRHCENERHRHPQAPNGGLRMQCETTATGHG